MGWPSEGAWLARADGARVRVGGKTWRLRLRVVDCGRLVLPTGRLVACDPFAGLQAGGNPYVQVLPGSYPVMVTLADVGGEEDGSHIREAYASLLLSAEPEVRREVLELGPAGESLPRLGPGEFVGFPVDAGTACFVDAGAIETAMPEGD
jgi:Protein of unknown function (DUF4241)